MKIVFIALISIASVHCQGDMMPVPIAKAEPQERAMIDDENVMLGARRQSFKKLKKFRMQEPAADISFEPQNTNFQRNMYQEIHANPAGFYVRAPANRAFKKYGPKNYKQVHGPVQPAHLMPQKENYGPVKPTHMLPQKESPAPDYHRSPAAPAHHPVPAPTHYAGPAPAPAPAHYPAPPPNRVYSPQYAQPAYHAPLPAHYVPATAHYGSPPAYYPPQPQYAQPKKSPSFPKYAKRHAQSQHEGDYVIPIPFELPPNPYCGACQGQVPQPKQHQRRQRDTDFENLTSTLNDGPNDDDDHAIMKRSTNPTTDHKLPEKYDCYASDGKTDLQAKAEFHFHVNESTAGQSTTYRPQWTRNGGAHRRKQHHNDEIVASPSRNGQAQVRMSLKERLNQLKSRDGLLGSTGNTSNSLQERFRNNLRKTIQQFQPHELGDQTVGQWKDTGSQQKLLTAIGDGVKSTVQRLVPDRTKAIGAQKDSMVSSAAGPKANQKLAASLRNFAKGTGDFVGSALSNLTANLGPKENTGGQNSNSKGEAVASANPSLSGRIKGTLEKIQPLARMQNVVQNLQEHQVGAPLMPRQPQIVVNPQSVMQAHSMFRKFVRPRPQPQSGLVGAVKNMLGVQQTQPPGPLRQNMSRLRNFVGLTTTTTARPDPPLKKMRDDGLKALKTTLEHVSSTFQNNAKANRVQLQATTKTRPIMVGNSRVDSEADKTSRQETRAERINNRKKERQEAKEARKQMVGARQKTSRSRQRNRKPMGNRQSVSVEKAAPPKTPVAKDDVLMSSKNSNNSSKVGANLAASVEGMLGAAQKAVNRRGQQLGQMLSNTVNRFAAGRKSGDPIVGNAQTKQKPANSPKVVNAFAKILNAVATSMEDMTLMLTGDSPAGQQVAPIVSPIADDILGGSKVAAGSEQVVHAKLLPGTGASVKIVIPELVLEFPASGDNTVKMMNDRDSIVGKFHTGQEKVTVFNPQQDVSILGDPVTEKIQELFEISSPMHESRHGKHKRGGLWAKRNRKLNSREGSKESPKVGGTLEKGPSKKLRKNMKLDRLIVNPLGATDDDQTLGMGKKGGKRLGKGSRELGSAELAKPRQKNRASLEARSGEKPGLGAKRKNFIKVLNQPQLGDTAGNKNQPKWLRRKHQKGRNSSGSKELADIVKELNNLDSNPPTGGSEESKPTFESESQNEACKKCKKLGGSPGGAVQAGSQVAPAPSKQPDSTLKKEEQPLIVLPDHLNPDKKPVKTTEKPKQPETTVVVATTTGPSTTKAMVKPKEGAKPHRPLFRSSNDLFTPNKNTPFRYTNIVASPRQDKRVLMAKPSPMRLPKPLPRPMLMDAPPRVQYTKLSSFENVENPPVFYADPKPETVDYLASIEYPLPGEIRLVAKTPKRFKKPLMHHNHISKEMAQPTTSHFKPTFQESLYDFCGCSSQLLINPEDFFKHGKHDIGGDDCRITLRKAKHFVASAIEDYSKCCKDCRHKVIDTVAAKMEDLERNSDMCEYFNADKAGPYVSKVCQFQNHGQYGSSTGPKIRQINMSSFLETTPSSPMIINEPTYEALATIFDPVTVPYKTAYTHGSRPSRSTATESPESKLQQIVDQLRQVLTETVFQKYTTDATTTFFTVASTNTTIASSPSTTANGRKTWVLSSGERSSLLASLISNERVKEFMDKLKVLKRQPTERNIGANEEASNFIHKLLNNMHN